jgi:hypothetical protein
MAQKQIYPLTILFDRYNAMFSKGKYTAFNLDPDKIPPAVYGGDLEHRDFWDGVNDGIIVIDSEVKYIGLGDTPDEAQFNLYLVMHGNKAT